MRVVAAMPQDLKYLTSVRMTLHQNQKTTLAESILRRTQTRGPAVARSSRLQEATTNQVPQKAAGARMKTQKQSTTRRLKKKTGT